ncbi:MAG: hypothetical protein GXP16_03850 [Gammaproteobacteria bacterium]|nr:hypothetical protein [Gammaproteobacteria bacterium]
MKRRNVLRSALLVGTWGVTGRALPHTMQFTTTQIRWQVNTRRWEIYHALHLDDAFELLARLGDPYGKLEVETQAKVLRYVEEKFALSLDGQILSLDPVGTQIEGDFLWIYQEYAMKKLPKKIDVRCQLLHELYPNQQNQINLVVGEEVKSGRTRPGTVLHSFSLSGLV